MKVAANYAGNDERARAIQRPHRDRGLQVGRRPTSMRARKASRKVEAELGPVDVLVNNAGITRDTTMKRMDRRSGRR